MPTRIPRTARAERPSIAPWQVWAVDFDPQVGREQAGRRPGIVVASIFACHNVNELVIVVPCTTRMRGLSYQPRVNLARRSVAQCDQVKSISTDRLVRLLPVTLSQEEISEVRFAVRRMFA
jgi:mRNA interferase MazF